MTYAAIKKSLYIPCISSFRGAVHTWGARTSAWYWHKTLLCSHLGYCRVVTKISCCRVNITSRWEIKQSGVSFGFIFLLFSDESSRGVTFIVAGRNSWHPPLNDSPGAGYITHFKILLVMVTGLKWSPIRSVIIRVINKIGRPRSGSPICLITSMITDRIGRHEVLLPINHNFNKICDI